MRKKINMKKTTLAKAIENHLKAMKKKKKIDNKWHRRDKKESKKRG